MIHGALRLVSISLTIVLIAIVASAGYPVTRNTELSLPSPALAIHFKYPWYFERNQFLPLGIQRAQQHELSALAFDFRPNHVRAFAGRQLYFRQPVDRAGTDQIPFSFDRIEFHGGARVECHPPSKDPLQPDQSVHQHHALRINHSTAGFEPYKLSKPNLWSRPAES